MPIYAPHTFYRAGFETGDLSEILSVVSNITPSTDYVRTGSTYSLKLGGASGYLENVAVIDRKTPRMYIGAWFYAPSYAAPSPDDLWAGLIFVRAPTAIAAIPVAIDLIWTTGGTYQLNLLSNDGDDATPNYVTEDQTTITPDQWFRLETMYHCNPPNSVVGWRIADANGVVVREGLFNGFSMTYFPERMAIPSGAFVATDRYIYADDYRVSPFGWPFDDGLKAGPPSRAGSWA